MFSDENFGKAFGFIEPKVASWMKELLGGAESLNLSRPQKELVQALTVETMLYGSPMPNEEIVAILADIIRNIATKHSYGKSLDWGKRAELFKSYEPK